LNPSSCSAYLFCMASIALSIGFGLWTAASRGLRLAGEYVLPVGWEPACILLVISAGAMAGFMRLLCRRFALPVAEWPRFAILVAAPSLVLDAFATLLFPIAYPNMPEAAAGPFGRWMLACCAGALIGSVVRR
jgi:hypothetical protein